MTGRLPAVLAWPALLTFCPNARVRLVKVMEKLAENGGKVQAGL
jgi:hypothetical protein